MNHDDDLDFAMFDLPTRPGPAKAAAAPEQDPWECRLTSESTAAEWAAHYMGLGFQCMQTAIEVKHGSGKVKV